MRPVRTLLLPISLILVGLVACTAKVPQVTDDGTDNSSDGDGGSKTSTVKGKPHATTA
jgi:hypothetical protein